MLCLFLYVTAFLGVLYIFCVVKSIKVYRGATGLTLLKIDNIKLELWYFPAGFSIEEHRHPNEYIKTVRLFGEAVFFRNRYNSLACHDARWYNYKKFIYTIKRVDYHWFTVGKRMPMIALNYEYWYTNRVTSASKDIQYRAFSPKSEITN